MAEPLVNQFITPAFVESLGVEIKKVMPSWDHDAFEKELYANWEKLALKQRLTRVAELLGKHLPEDYLEALAVLKQACTSFSGFDGLVFSSFVELYGLEHFEQSLEALALFTQHGSAEGAIRPFIMAREDETMQKMLEWSQHENEHVRRLSSEGCRPRLPWAPALPAFKKDPSKIFPILENLKNDPSEYVRKSVANNLNDITRDNPQEVLQRLEAWSHSDSSYTRWIIKHALRSLVKAGDATALRMLGHKEADIGLVSLSITTPTVKFGKSLEFSAELNNRSNHEASIVVDYAIHFMKANGELAPKVFKLKNLHLAPGESIVVRKAHAIKPITTRRYYPGKHLLAIQVNGKVLSDCPFELEM